MFDGRIDIVYNCTEFNVHCTDNLLSPFNSSLKMYMVAGGAQKYGLIY